MSSPRLGRPPLLANPRERILDEAARVFGRGGYDKGSLAEVAAEVGVTKAAVYHYFKSKQAIYDAVIVRTLAGLTAYVEAALAEVAPGERLRGFMLAHARYFEANHWAFACMLTGYGEMQDAALRAEATRLRDGYERRLRDLIAAGVAAGSFRTLDVRVAGRSVLSLLNWMVRWFRPGGGRSAESFAAEYYDFLALGLRGGAEAGVTHTA